MFRKEPPDPEQIRTAQQARAATATANASEFLNTHVGPAINSMLAQVGLHGRHCNPISVGRSTVYYSPALDVVWFEVNNSGIPQKEYEAWLHRAYSNYEIRSGRPTGKILVVGVAVPR